MEIDPGSETNSANQGPGEQRQRLAVLQETLQRVRDEGLAMSDIAPAEADTCSLCKPYIRDVSDGTKDLEQHLADYVTMLQQRLDMDQTEHSQRDGM